MSKKSRKETSPFNYLQDQLRRRKNSPPSNRSIKRLVEAVEDAPRKSLPTPPRFNIHDTRRLPDRQQQALIAFKRARKTRNRTRKDRKKIAIMQKKLMAVEDGPNGPIVSRNNSPRRKSNSSSDQSFYSAQGSPQRRRNSSSDQSFYSGKNVMESVMEKYLREGILRLLNFFAEDGPNGPIVSRNNSPRRKSSSSSDQSFYSAQGSPQRIYCSAYDGLFDFLQDQLRRNSLKYVLLLLISFMEKYLEEVKEANRRKSPMRWLFAEDGPNGKYNIQIKNNRMRHLIGEREKIVAMQEKWVDGLDIEDGPNGPIVSRNNSPRRKSNAPSDQSFYSAYSNLGSPQKRRNSSSDEYYSAFSDLDDSIQIPRYESDPEYYGPAPYYGPRTSSPLQRTPPAFFDFGGELSPITQNPTYESSTVASSRNASGSFEQPMDISGTILEPMDVSSRILDPMDVSSRYNLSRM